MEFTSLTRVFGDGLELLMPEERVPMVTVYEILYLLLNESSDRGVALIGAALLEKNLEEIIVKSLIDSSEDIFNSGGLFDTFAKKIKICYLLGRIDKEMVAELNSIRRIRNSFAHEFDDINFESSKIRDWAMSMSFYEKFESLAETGSAVSAQLGSQSVPRKRFTASVIGLAFLLKYSAVKATAPTPLTIYKAIENDWKARKLV